MPLAILRELISYAREHGNESPGGVLKGLFHNRDGYIAITGIEQDQGEYYRELGQAEQRSRTDVVCRWALSSDVQNALLSTSPSNADLILILPSDLAGPTIDRANYGFYRRSEGDAQAPFGFFVYAENEHEFLDLRLCQQSTSADTSRAAMGTAVPDNCVSARTIRRIVVSDPTAKSAKPERACLPADTIRPERERSRRKIKILRRDPAAECARLLGVPDPYPLPGYQLPSEEALGDELRFELTLALPQGTYNTAVDLLARELGQLPYSLVQFRTSRHETVLVCESCSVLSKGRPAVQNNDRSAEPLCWCCYVVATTDPRLRDTRRCFETVGREYFGSVSQIGVVLFENRQAGLVRSSLQIQQLTEKCAFRLTPDGRVWPLPAKHVLLCVKEHRR